MSRQDLTRAPFFRLIETILAHISKPFYKADSLDRYKTAGYLYIFGPALLLFFLGLWWLGDLTSPWVRSLIEWLLEVSHLKSFPQLPIILLVFAIYVGLYAKKSVRLAIGEVSANLFFKLMTIPLSAGEWCIEHRSKTTILFIVLFGFLAWGIPNYVASRVKENKEVERLSSNFDYWLKSVEEFIESSPLTGKELETYSKVYPWRQEFEKVIKHPSDTMPTAACLHEMLEAVYRTDLPIATTYLEMKLPMLEDKMASCKHRPESPMSDPEARAWIVMNILMGRVYTRLLGAYIFPSEKHKAPEKEKAEYALVHAQTCFNDADTTLKNAAGLTQYQAAVSNGQGTVYANAFTAFYITGIELLRLNKTSPADCANAALNAYNNSIRDNKDASPCAFLAKRSMNNTASLLARIGYWYDRVDLGELQAPLSEWSSSREKLRKRLEGEIIEIMKCNTTEPLLAKVTFSTAAEAYAVCAKLRQYEVAQAGVKDLGDDAEAVNYIKKAAVYLRLAHSFRKEIVPLTKLYFQFIYDHKKLLEAFKNALNSAEFANLPEVPEKDLRTGGQE